MNTLHRLVVVSVMSLGMLPLDSHANGPVCAGSAAQEIHADLAQAQDLKVTVGEHLQRVESMRQAVQTDPNASAQTTALLMQAQSKDQDAMGKLNERIEADQSCLESSSCTEIVHVSNIRGHVVLARSAHVEIVKSICDLQPGDALRTGKNGAADLVIMGGKRIIHMGPDMEFSMPAKNHLIINLLDEPASSLTIVIGVRG
jgi:hypothetical protein